MAVTGSVRCHGELGGSSKHVLLLLVASAVKSRRRAILPSYQVLSSIPLKIGL